jgi:ElaA protein
MYRGPVTVDYRLAPLADIDAETLYRILWLRVRVFVVEQSAAYEELDGRDIEPGALVMWAESDGDVLGTLRILTDEGALRIGRVATSESARGRGVGAELMRRAVAHCVETDAARPIDLDAQKHLAPWYARFGFEVSGAEFVEDDIPHVPMRRRPGAPTEAD